MKSESKSAIKELAEVQSELLQCKRDEIEYFQNGVQSTNKTELKSYSEAVKKSKNEQVILKKIKTVVKDIVEDRSRNIMMFGLEETERENLDYKVRDVFEELKEKPLLRAERVGRKTSEDSDRPVKVSMESSLIVSDILKKSKDLKQSVFSHVNLKPDRTLEQRLKHKKIVAELKKSIQEVPEKHHFIKNGEVCNQGKVVKQESTDTAARASRGSGVKKEKKNPRKLLPHHIAANRRPPLSYASPLTTDTTDCD